MGRLSCIIQGGPIQSQIFKTEESFLAESEKQTKEEGKEIWTLEGLDRPLMALKTERREARNVGDL